jgi:hypothetical protein
MRFERISEPTAHAPDVPPAHSAYPPDPFTSQRPRARRRSRAAGRACRRDAWPAATARDVVVRRMSGGEQ